MVEFVSFIFVLEELFLKGVLAHDQERDMFRTDRHRDPSVIQVVFREIVLVPPSAAVCVAFWHLDIGVGRTSAFMEIHFIQRLKHKGVLPPAVVPRKQQFFEEVIQPVVDRVQGGSNQAQSLLNCEDGLVVEVKYFGDFKVNFIPVWEFRQLALKNVEALVFLQGLVRCLAFLGQRISVYSVVVLLNGRSFDLGSLFRLHLPVFLLFL